MCRPVVASTALRTSLATCSSFVFAYGQQFLLNPLASEMGWHNMEKNKFLLDSEAIIAAFLSSFSLGLHLIIIFLDFRYI